MRVQRILTALALIAGLGGTAAPALAQGSAGCGEVMRVLAEIRRDEDRIRDRLAACTAPEVHTLLQKAHESLQNAESTARGNRCREAELQARFARGLLDRAIRLCEEGDAYSERLLEMLGHTDQLLRDAADTSHRVDTPLCRRLVEAAERQQQNARQQFRAGQHRFALTLTLSAREMAERVLRCAETGNAFDPAALSGDLDRTDRLLGEVRRVLDDADDPGAAAGFLDEASRLQAEARRQATGPNPGLALRLTLQARAIASRALTRVDVGFDVEELRPMAESTADLLDVLEDAARTAGDRAILERLRRARRLLDDGLSAIDRGDARTAWSKLRASSALALEASSHLGFGGGR